MKNLGTNEFLIFNTGKITPQKSFVNLYIEEVYGSENLFTSTKLLYIILYAKYEKAHLNKVIKSL